VCPRQPLRESVQKGRGLIFDGGIESFFYPANCGNFQQLSAKSRTCTCLVFFIFFGPIYPDLAEFGRYCPSELDGCGGEICGERFCRPAGHGREPQIASLFSFFLSLSFRCLLYSIAVKCRSEGWNFLLFQAMTLIVERLQMCRWTHVNHLLYWHQRRIKNLTHSYENRQLFSPE
jgi:hypothetical protein